MQKKGKILKKNCERDRKSKAEELSRADLEGIPRRKIAEQHIHY